MHLSSTGLVPSFLKKRKACFIWPYFGPQYFQRFDACKRYLKDCIEFYCIALSSQTKSYPFWINQYPNIFYWTDKYWEDESPAYLFKKVHYYLANINPDVVFTHSYSTVDARSAAIYALEKKKKLCIMSDSHYSDYRRSWYVELVKSLLIKGADSMLVSGPMQSHYYGHNLRFDHQIFFGYSALSPSHLHSLALRSDQSSIILDSIPNKPFLFCAARPLQKKNVPALCNAWRNSKAAESSLLVIAGGEACDYNVSDYHESILFLGSLSPEQVLLVISRSSGCILPSTSEQFGNFITEAIAFRKPILLSNKLGCLDLALRYNPSYLFNPFSLEDIIIALDSWNLELPQPGEEVKDSEYLFPLAVHVRDFVSNVYNIVFSYQRSRPLDKLISLILFYLVAILFRNKQAVDLNLDR